jgi:hypothetical protein
MRQSRESFVSYSSIPTRVDDRGYVFDCEDVAPQINYDPDECGRRRANCRGSQPDSFGGYDWSPSGRNLTGKGYCDERPVVFVC